MKNPKKTHNIILRTTKEEHNTIKLKSTLFNKSKSNYIRHASLSHWEDTTSTKYFKKLLKIYQESDEVIKEQTVDLLFEYYRRTGFPYYHLTDKQKENRLHRVMKSKNILLEDDHLQMNPQGLDLANFFHPHMMKAYYSRGENSPLQTFNNDEGLKDCINRWMELGNIPNPAGIRRILKIRDGTRAVLNFKPTIAKFIYDNHVPDNGKTLDPCAGYGGRLLGCIAANKNIFYHGIDPVGETTVGNTRLSAFFSTQYDMFEQRLYRYGFRFDMGCAEEIMPQLTEKYDLIFTSPPFFNTEIYSEDKNQSGIKYNEYKEWLNKFLLRIVKESYRLLTDEGKLILNVKNLAYHKIADDLCDYCKRDWILEKTYHMRLSNSEFFRVKGNTFHTEPIFVFGKKE